MVFRDVPGRPQRRPGRRFIAGPTNVVTTLQTITDFDAVAMLRKRCWRATSWLTSWLEPPAAML